MRKLLFLFSSSLLLFSCISQDPGNLEIPVGLGVVDGRLAPMPSSPNAVSSQTDIEDKYVEPLQFQVDLPTSYQKILQVLAEIEEDNEIIVQTDNYLHVVFTTGLMRFNDDVEFYFDNSSSLIHYRSASRIGYSDLGKNRSRYEEISKRYYEE
jgi:uncharacterized protein (DUF1499 family)